MGRFSEWFYGTENEPQSSDNVPEARSSEPSLPTPNVDEALLIPHREDYSRSVSSGEALGLVGVYRAAQIISTAVFQLSLDATRDGEPLTPKPLILRRPDPDASLSAVLEMTTLSLVLNGNAFWRVFRDNQGRVTGIRVLNPREVQIKTDAQGNVTLYSHGGRDHTKAEIKHLAHMRVPGAPEGRGPIQAAQAELRGALDGRDYSANWLQESGVPTGILKSDQQLNEIQAQQYKAAWDAAQGGQRGTAVLGAGLTYSPVYLSPSDAQWIEARQFDTTAIARLFGIPASLMIAATEGSSMTYTNVAQSWTEFSRFTLARYVIEIEEAFSDLLPRGTEVKANLEALLRPDTVTRYQMHLEALQAGWLSVNEVRAIEGYKPAPDGDFKTAAEKVAEAQAFAAPAPTEEEGSDE